MEMQTLQKQYEATPSTPLTYMSNYVSIKEL